MSINMALISSVSACRFVRSLSHLSARVQHLSDEIEVGASRRWIEPLSSKMERASLAAAGCSGPLHLNQAGDRFLNLASGLREAGGLLVFAAVRVGERLNLFREAPDDSSSSCWSSCALPLIARARRQAGQARGSTRGKLGRGTKDDDRRFRYHLRSDRRWGPEPKQHRIAFGPRPTWLSRMQRA